MTSGRRATIAALSLSLPLLTACATLVTMNADQGRHFGPYSGTRLDLRAIEASDLQTDDALRRLSYVDLPLSFVCDTALLPLAVIDGLLLPQPIVFTAPE